MAGQRPRQGGNKHDGPCWVCRLRDGPQPPQVQCMRWQTRCMPSTTQRLGTKRHTRQVKADRQPRYTPDRPKLQVRTTWQSRPTLRPAGCAVRGGAASPTAPQATSANSQLRSLRIAMRPKERCWGLASAKSCTPATSGAANPVGSGSNCAPWDTLCRARQTLSTLRMRWRLVARALPQQRLTC